MSKNYIWNLATYSCENDKCVGSVIDDSLIICDEIIEETKIVPTKTVPIKVVRINSIKKS